MAENTSDPLNDRVTALEELVSHQARTIEELSATIAAQWGELDRAKRKLDALTKRFLELEEASAPSHEITRPPHY